MTLLPPNATAFEKNIEATTARVGAVDLSVIGKLWDPFNCPPSLLPWLAWAMDVDPWNPQWTESQQRSAINASLPVHRKRGTVAAVKQALDALGYDITISENDSDTFVFRIQVNVSTTGLDEDSVVADATALANAAKNARSKLGGVGPAFDFASADPDRNSSSARAARPAARGSTRSPSRHRRRSTPASTPSTSRSCSPR